MNMQMQYLSYRQEIYYLLTYYYLRFIAIERFHINDNFVGNCSTWSNFTLHKDRIHWKRGIRGQTHVYVFQNTVDRLITG